MKKVILVFSLFFVVVSPSWATLINGRITRLIGGSGVAFAEVDLYTAAGVFDQTTIANATGDYSFIGLNPGTYFVRTRVSDNLIDKWYAVANVVTGVPSSDGATLINIPSSFINIALQEGGQIEGAVRDFNNQPIAGLTIEVYESLVGQPSRLAESVLTAVDGTYTASGLRSAQYYVRTRDLNLLNVIDEWYNNVLAIEDPFTDSATLTAVIAPATVTGRDFTLAEGGSIAGRVTSSNGSPINGMSVKVFTANGELMDEVLSGSNGDYLVNGLPASSFYVRSDSAEAGLSFVDAWFDDVAASGFNPLADGATAVGTQLAVTNMNITLALVSAVSISGRITSRDIFNNVSAVENCQIFLSDGGSTTGVVATTDSNGDYTITGLTSGRYYLATLSNPSDNLVDEWYADRLVTSNFDPVSDGATPIDTVVGPNPGIDVQLASGGIISGTVRGSSVGPLSGVTLSIQSLDGTVMREVLTDGSGNYSSIQLPSKTYYVSTEKLPPVYAGFLPEWFDNAIRVDDNPAEDGATIITLAVGEVFTVADFDLVEGADLVGRVSDPLGLGLLNVPMELYNATGQLFRAVDTAFNGEYRFKRLPVGDYFVRSRLVGSPYLDEWYNDRVVSVGNPFADAADIVSLTSTVEVTGIDIQLAEGFTITGLVQNASFAPIPNLILGAYDNLGRFIAEATTDASGTYTLSGLAAGSYGVRTVDAAPFANEWWNDIPAFTFISTIDAPLAITVGNALPVPNASFLLENSGSMGGQVTEDGGGPLAEIPVEIFSSSGAHRVTAMTDTNGSWQANGLNPGGYYVRTGMYDGFNYFDEWFSDRPTTSEGPVADGATLVTVTASNHVPNVDFEVDAGSKLIHLDLLVNVAPELRLNWSGLPGYRYRLKRTNDLLQALPWPDASAQVAPSNGVVQVDLNAGADDRAFFYAALDPYYRETVENLTNGWSVFNSNDSQPTVNWQLAGSGCFDGQRCWFGLNLASRADLSLVSPQILITNQTELSFWHRYELEDTFDAGVVEVSITGNPLDSSDVGPFMTLNPYNSNISVNSGNPIEGRPAFTGNSGGYVRTVVDLTPFVNDTIQIRFRLTCDVGSADVGWWIDNIMIR